MKRRFILIVVAIIFVSCNQPYIPRTIESIVIEEYKIDSASIRAIQAMNVDHLVYAGSNGTIGTTKDNGNSWKVKKIIFQDTIVPHFRSLAFNGNHLYALSVGNPALLYRISEDESTLVYSELHEKVFYDSLHFFEDQLHGIGVGDPTDDCASIIVTHDGGANWKKVACEFLPKFEEGEAFFAASNTNIKTLGSTVWIASGGEKARVLKSTDFGKTWEIFSTPIQQGTGPQGIYSIDFYDQMNGIIVGGDYTKPLENTANKAITIDGGKTWKLVADGQNPNYKSCVQYVPNTHGKEIFAVGKTGVSFSNDAGITWKDISNDSYYAIQFVNEHTAWLSGHHKIGKLELNTLFNKSK